MHDVSRALTTDLHRFLPFKRTIQISRSYLLSEFLSFKRNLSTWSRVNIAREQSVRKLLDDSGISNEKITR